MTKKEREEQAIYQSGFNAAFDEIEEVLRLEAVRLDHELKQPYPKDVLFGIKCKIGELETLREELFKV